jgi:hypothetical protein
MLPQTLHPTSCSLHFILHHAMHPTSPCLHFILPHRLHPTSCSLHFILASASLSTYCILHHTLHSWPLNNTGIIFPTLYNFIIRYTLPVIYSQSVAFCRVAARFTSFSLLAIVHWIQSMDYGKCWSTKRRMVIYFLTIRYFQTFSRRSQLT